MEYRYSELGFLSAGTKVRVDLRGTEANVMLLDEQNYRLYRAGRGGYRYVGGHTKQTPVVLATSHAARWYGVADLGGHGGRLGVSFTVLG